MFLTGLRETLERLSLTYISPSSVTAAFALVLAVLVLYTNHRRSINRAWALVLFMIVMWQAGAASIYWLREPTLHRIGIFFGGLFIFSLGFLKETIIAPRTTVKLRLKRIWFHTIIVAIFTSVFTDYYISRTSINGMYPRHTWYWIVNACNNTLGLLLTYR